MARFLVRFDDICPTMDWASWRRVERVLRERDVRPILAVVPDNRDPKLEVAQANPRFWDEVRAWQAQGWTIGWHGYQHVYATASAGIVGLNERSEFAGVPPDRQREALERALAIFANEGVRPDVWVAPGHSFDWHTVRILGELGVDVISDGFFIGPRSARGATFVPQQLWRFRPISFGTWTVCYHCNGWSELAQQRFERDLVAYRDSITSLPSVLDAHIPPLNAADRLVAATYRLAVVGRRALAAARRHP